MYPVCAHIFFGNICNMLKAQNPKAEDIFFLHNSPGGAHMQTLFCNTACMKLDKFIEKRNLLTQRYDKHGPGWFHHVEFLGFLICNSR